MAEGFADLAVFSWPDGGKNMKNRRNDMAKTWWDGEYERDIAASPDVRLLT